MTTGTETEAGVQRITYLQAIHQAQIEELRRDPATVIIGEDLRSNLYGANAGFLDEFGPDRVLDAPLSEAGFVGAGIGAAMTGLRPIVDITFATFLYCAMDQLVSQAAKNRYMFGGQADIPLTLRASMAYAGNNAAHHSDRPYPIFMTVPGLKILAPSTPSDAKGLLKTAIRTDDPVLVFEDTALWGRRGEVADTEEHLVPLGVADVKRAGTDITVVAISGSVHEALKAAELLADEISVEVLDPRTLVPMDWEAIFRSVGKTSRLAIVEPAHRTCGAAAEIAATVAEHAFGSLSAPVIRITTPDMQIPFSPGLLKGFYPDADRIATAIRRLMDGKTTTVMHDAR